MDIILSQTPILSKDQTDGMVRSWLAKGWADFKNRPVISLIYGAIFVVLSWSVVLGLSITGLLWMLLPALSGAMLVGPVIAVGLYQVSRKLNNPEQSKIEAPGQIALIGGILMILLLIWIRSATILFALFYGLKSFPGFSELLQTLFQTQSGLLLLIVGSLVGGLFAAFGFAITAFSLPMLIARPVDAFTAMGKSFSASTHNFWLIFRWAIVITVLTVIGFATGMLLMIVIFPLLAYATWHAYSDVFETFSPSMNETKKTNPLQENL